MDNRIIWDRRLDSDRGRLISEVRLCLRRLDEARRLESQRGMPEARMVRIRIAKKCQVWIAFLNFFDFVRKVLRLDKSDSRAPFTRTLDRLSERSYCKDYQRLGLCTRAEVTLHSGNQTSAGSSGGTGVGISLTRSNEGHFRLTVVNRTYSVCRT